MRVVIAGLGVQGQKRRAVAGNDVVATVDTAVEEADFNDLTDVPLADYDAALLCTPDTAKIDLLTYLLENGKSVLVEKPLFAGRIEDLETLRKLAAKKAAVCYTAYNHRFEPHFVRMKEVLASGGLGKVYSCRMFYGNGTARLVRESNWRDQGSGVLHDLGSHLLDTALYWFGKPETQFRIVTGYNFENRACDHVSVVSDGVPLLQMEATLLSWRNHFYADLFAEKGSAHIRSLCKWGPSTFTLRDRKLPSGRPDETSETLTRQDPTWALEYAHFKQLVADPAGCGYGNTENDIWLFAALESLARQLPESMGR